MSFSLVVGKRFLVVGTFSTNALKSQCQNHHHGSYWATRMFMSSTTSLAATPPRGLRPPPPAAAVTSFLGTTFHNKNAFPSSSSSSLLLLPTPINHALLIMRGKNTLKTNRSIAKRLRPRGNRTLKRYVWLICYWLHSCTPHKNKNTISHLSHTHLFLNAERAGTNRASHTIQDTKPELERIVLASQRLLRKGKWKRRCNGV